MVAQKNKEDWYKEWFESPLYHILYKHRNPQEAAFFINNLIDYLGINKQDRILDLASGKGRHSVQLSKAANEVVGLDLSSRNIREARKYEHKGLRFVEGDMRDPVAANHFDFIVNLFTSFGYFSEVQDDLRVVRAVRESLKPGGIFVLDFFNTEKIVRELRPYSEHKTQNASFQMERHLSGGFIRKHIRVSQGGKLTHFEERVRALTLDDFLRYFEMESLQLVEVFGSYEMQPYDEDTSPRMIMVARK